MTTGLVSITYRQLTPDEIIALVKRSGLDEIEWGGDIHVPCGDMETAKAVGEKTRAAGLGIACYGSYCRMTDEEKDAGVFRQTVDTAKALGAPLIRVWAGKKGSAEATEADREEIVRNAQLLGDMAAQAGIDVAFEYHGRTLTDERTSALRLLQAVGRGNVGCLWQPPVDMSVEDCLASIDTVAPYIRNIHVFSWNHTERLPLRDGSEKWNALLGRLRNLPGTHKLLIEFVAQNAPEQLPADAACLREWLKG